MSYTSFDLKEKRKIIMWLTLLIFIVCFIAVSLLFGIPMYNVWKNELRGKAALREAQWTKQVIIEEAMANLEAEKLNALAEVERAKGAAKAIEIENGTLTDTYIQYLWVRQQNKLNEKTVIYIPTETNLPILEANRNKDSSKN